MEFLIILVLILLNAIFSMSEIALVSARRIRLENSAKKGSRSARSALDLLSSPDRFLSTVQIGITLISILTGIYSGESFSKYLDAFFEQFESIQPYAHTISVALIVIVTSYLTLVIGELVPKRLGLTNPEVISRMVAGPMLFLSKIVAPFVWLLSISTNAILKLLNVKKHDDSRVTEEEIKAIIQEGTEGGEVQEVEQDIVERAFFLGDRKIGSLATHRSDLVWIEVNESIAAVKKKVVNDLHHVYPIADKSLDGLLGVIYLKDLFGKIDDPDFCLTDHIAKAPFVHEGRTVYSVLAQLKDTRIHYAFVTDEFGSIEGMVTLHDILEALVSSAGELADDIDIPAERSDGSILMDGQYPFYDFLSYFDKQDTYSDHPYNTLSGLLLDKLKHVPKAGDKLSWLDFEFEIMDMDGARIDKVLISKKS